MGAYDYGAIFGNFVTFSFYAKNCCMVSEAVSLKFRGSLRAPTVLPRGSLGAISGLPRGSLGAISGLPRGSLAIRRYFFAKYFENFSFWKF